MHKNIVISNEPDLEDKIKRISKDGKDKFHVLADFDRTLTKAFVEGVKSPTVIAQIRNGNYLTPGYAPKAHELFDIYHPIEINTNVSAKEKNTKMHEWWKKHFELLVECGLTKKVMEEIVSQKTLKFREGTLEFIDLLHKYDVPLVIMSAGPGDMIKMYLEQEGRLYDNVQVIANFLKFDSSGKAIGVHEPIIHSCNKHEIELKKLLVYEELLKRKNVLLLGDSLEDLGMIEGFDYKTLISIGFLNEEVEANLSNFKRSFDVVLLNDGDFSYVNKLVKRIL
jgi:cytosolic 5'-nucleotidase 3